MRTLTTTTALGVGVVIVMAAGVGVAATSSTSSKTFSACLTNKTHSLTGVTRSPSKPRHCKAGSTPVSWNAKGVAGPRGLAGPAATYVPLLSMENSGCGGASYWPEPDNGCPVDPLPTTSNFNSTLINSADFAAGATVQLQASFMVSPTNDVFPKAEVCARLLDVTTQAVVGKPLCASNTDPDNESDAFLSTAPVALPKGDDNYKLEVAMPKSITATPDITRGGFVTQAVAVVAG